jgi:hypothetical protein
MGCAIGSPDDLVNCSQICLEKVPENALIWAKACSTRESSEAIDFAGSKWGPVSEDRPALGRGKFSLDKKQFP